MQCTFRKRTLSSRRFVLSQAAGLIVLFGVVPGSLVRSSDGDLVAHSQLRSLRERCWMRRLISPMVPTRSESETWERRKLVLTSNELETLDGVRYTELAVRVSKRCTFVRARPVVIEAMTARLHPFQDEGMPLEHWERFWVRSKLGPIAVVRLGRRPFSSHASQLLVGAWWVSGYVPGFVSAEPLFVEDAQSHELVFSGRFGPQYLFTTVIDSRTLTVSRSEWDLGSLPPCRHAP